MSAFIFHDPSGKRARRSRLAQGLLLAVIALFGAGFAGTLAFAPRLPYVAFRSPRNLAALHPEFHKRHELPWSKSLRRVRYTPTPGAASGRPLTLAFYVSWDETSRASLKRHVEQVDVLAPQWVSLTTGKGDVDVVKDAQADAIVAASKRHPAVMPVLFNAKNAAWDGPEADALIGDRAAQDRLIATLRDQARKSGWAGYVFDLENMGPKGLAGYPAFLARARAALAQDGRQLWATAPFDDTDWPVKAMGKATDQMVVMAYDEHWLTGEAGPTAGQGWYEANLDRVTHLLDPAHTIIALGSYGYEWPRGGGSADPMTFHESTQAAKDSGAQIMFDPASLNPTFAYKGDDGQDRDVWFTDAVTAFNEIQVADSWRPHGYGLWRMGSEDPGVWKVLGQPYGEASADTLSDMPSTNDVDFDGSGEVLRITATPLDGRRDVTLDASGLVKDERYAVIPSGYTVQRLGYHPGEVALTFDDGPDSRWTSKILDILKREHVPATFFVLGENMEKRPDLVEREIAEGHDVGSHSFTHPNISAVPVAEAKLELNATQRLFETITGRSLRLFRPPYFGDAEPSTPDEVKPLLMAQGLGYITVGLRIDPDDWKKPQADLITARVLDRLEHPGNAVGQVVLLHDSGGDRRQTIAALPVLIAQLRAHGYKMVTIADLAGMTPQQVMPPTKRGSVELAIDRFVFFWIRYGQLFLRGMMLTAIGLGIARLIFLATLSLWHRFVTAKHTPPEISSTGGPLISVLIPCFNEEKVIVESVSRVLASEWDNLEIVVLDDGSSDETSSAVQAAYADEPRVRLVRLENGGKARALNHGLTLASGEVVVALDADTLFPPQTLGLLMRWFSDPVIGAVAGNALVGNRVNLVTRWQALEYVTAQNLERRALAALGAVTVVPGAVGAWRKAALQALGGYPVDTLAEDQDLTLAVQQAGWKVTFDSEARAYTESPDTVQGLLKQRFRWSFGTLQCLWKHRQALFNRKTPTLGFVALPQVWLFQIVLTVAAPLVDLAMVWSLISAWMAHQSHPVEYDPQALMRTIAAWATFVLLDLAAGSLGMALERQAPWKDLIWLPFQRFGYRQMMYYVVVRAVEAAIQGRRVGWSKLERRASVSVQNRPAKA